jgi:hypothetical protein
MQTSRRDAAMETKDRPLVPAGNAPQRGLKEVARLLELRKLG